MNDKYKKIYELFIKGKRYNEKMRGENKMFKIGDKVKITRGSYEGQTGVIKTIINEPFGDKSGIGYRLNNNDLIWWDSEFELIKEEKRMFKVGDRVKLVSTEDEMPEYAKRLGKIGVVDFVSGNCLNREYVRVKWQDGYTVVTTPFVKNLELVEEPIKLSKENKKIVKEVEEKIAVLENAKTKHLTKIKRIDKELADLKVKKDKHMVEEVKEITLADIEDKFGCKVKIVKEK